jgi:conserved hypothetical integral membrane protein TIGR02206
MGELFAKDITTDPFVMFSKVHIITVIVIVLINAGFIILFKKCSSKKVMKTTRYLLAGLMLANELSYMVWSVVTGDWSMEYSLPLQLCEILTFLLAYMLISENYLAFEISYFITFGGALQAIVTPDLYFPFPHYRFFNFFLSHGLMFVAIFYMIIVNSYRPKLSSIWKTMVALNIYMIILIPINILTKGNYMFLCEKPVDGSILDFLGPWPWYLFSLEGVGLVMLVLCYLPFAVANSVKRNTASGSGNLPM